MILRKIRLHQFYLGKKKKDMVCINLIFRKGNFLYDTYPLNLCLLSKAQKEVKRNTHTHTQKRKISLMSLMHIFFQVKGTVFKTDNNGALVDITAKSSAYLPVQEACIHKIKHVEDAGIVPGLKDEFVIIGENEVDDSLILSLRSIQYELAWERCRQLQTEDVVVKGKVGFPKICFFSVSSFVWNISCDPCQVFSFR